MLQRIMLGLLLAAATAAAIDISKLQPQGYVSDFSGVVDARSKVELERFSRLVKERTGAELAFVTVDTLDDDPIEDVANKLYAQWGVGVKGKDEGLLLLLAIKDRRSRLEIGYGLEPILPDGLSGEVLRNMRPALREGAYGDAFIAAAQSMGTRIAQAKGVRLDGSELQPSRQRDEEGGIPPIVIIFGVIAFFIFLNSVSHNSGGPRMGGGGPIIWGGGGRSPRSGGGFGGFDSGGGGFGGFGGGSSGGGGASNNW